MIKSIIAVKKENSHAVKNGGKLTFHQEFKYHRPVLLDEVLAMLAPQKGGVFLDATVGTGGHAMAILEKLQGEGLLICADRDEDALRISMERLKAKNVVFVKSRFSELSKKIEALGINGIDGALFDLGVSLYQLKSGERGFGFSSDSRLDMRMDRSGGITAWDVVNTYPEERLMRIIKEYGEEPVAARIVRAIIRKRKDSPINTPKELAELIEKTLGKRGRIHPATRTFQAIRIEVNDELNEIRKGLASIFEFLNRGGRICVISYHSLEDRIVKHTMKEWVKREMAELLTKKPVTPSSEELRLNPSSRSAKLRGAKRL
ncbi:MAG: 16S rRNA (cytosine(1402)-N(4))-methyltransferase RsmH [Thermodesulfovibrionales bacterium]|nr:16S rRNA (cytosine(1402)-N(4))-methyltransferase RsmH [Thermodesulfovibrionales bacterium]